MVFIALTSVVLVIDLERPERFYYILTRSNWRSWMVWGAWFLRGARRRSAACGWWPAGSAGRVCLTLLAWPAIVFAVLATAYTGFLFAQGLGRDLWQGPHAAVAPDRAVGRRRRGVAAARGPRRSTPTLAARQLARLDPCGLAGRARADPAVRERAARRARPGITSSPFRRSGAGITRRCSGASRSPAAESSRSPPSWRWAARPPRPSSS